jgi:sodium-coupled monocarboxylate transporter 8/12
MISCFKDQLLPLIVVDTMSSYPGLSGFFVAGIFSGSLSTVSSAINSLAAVTLEDYVKPFRKTTLSEGQSTFLLKAIAISYGLLSVILTFIVDLLGPSVLQV